ncbi:MAG: isochorismatase family protein [Myxococcales bacterium]
MDPLRLRLDRNKAALLVVDIQDRLCAAMDPKALDRLIRRTRALIEGARALELPILVTEQYPKGLGNTLGPIRAALGDEQKVVEKVEFSCAIPEVVKGLTGRPQVLIAGMETHVCVYQTARDLSERKFVPFLCADAVLSRNEEDRAIGLERCREAGAVVTTVEGALFDLLGRAGTPEFKRVSAAVK